MYSFIGEYFYLIINYFILNSKGILITLEVFLNSVFTRHPFLKETITRIFLVEIVFEYLEAI